MRAILYLSAVRLKNSLLDWLRRPARLITLLLFAALLLFSMLGARSSPLELRRPQAELGALILLLYAAVFIVSIWQGLAFTRWRTCIFFFPPPFPRARCCSMGCCARQAARC